MRFIATADTDIGISKDTNQDSVLIKGWNTLSQSVLNRILLKDTNPVMN